MIYIYSPNIEPYTTSVKKAIDTGWISNHGEYIEKSSQLFREKLGIKHVILMNNGTCATHCLFIALKYKYPNINTIYIPNNVYIAAWNSCFMEYTKKQVKIMKMDLDTWNINTDEEYIQSLETNSAVLIVHNLGNIINVPRLKRIRPDLIFLEDNCEGFTGKYENVYSGTSDSTLCSSVSFYGNKIITTGEGGAFMTNDDNIYEHIKKVYSQGMSNYKYIHEIHAYNYRMSNVQAAFLYDQLNDYENIINTKQRVFDTYRELLKPLLKSNKIKLFTTENDTIPANWIFGIRLLNNKISIKQLNEFFNNNGVEIRPFFYPINCHNHLSDITINDDDPIPSILNREIIMLPSSPTITIDEQKYIIKLLDHLDIS